MDTVAVRLSSDSGESTGEAETEVLVPSLREGEIFLFLESHLLQSHTHYTASFTFNQQQSVSTTFCECIKLIPCALLCSCALLVLVT